MERKEHLKWCKERALEFVEKDDLTNAFSSFQGDMMNHEETKNHIALKLGMNLLLSGNLGTQEQMKEWIIGFN